MSYLINAFFSGLLTYFYLLVESWYWAFGLFFVLGCGVLEAKEIKNEYEDDNRMIL